MDRLDGGRERRTLGLLFLVMLAIAAGNTALQSVLPAIGRSLGVADALVAVAFSLSAVVWSVSASFWARRSGRGRRRLIVIGLAGFIASLVCCGIALTAGLRGWIGPVAAFGGFVIGRIFYGAFGSAAPPAAQAMVATASTRDERTRVLTLLASAFGLGTILGPALAPFFLLPFVGLAGPAFVFAGFGIAVLLLVLLRLREPGDGRRGAAPAEPSIAGLPAGASVITAAANTTDDRTVRWRDARVRRWLAAGIAAGHAQAMVNQTMGFLVMDRLALAPASAQPLIGVVLMAGACAALLAQWGLIPMLNLTPPALLRWGGLTGAAGCLLLGAARDLHLIAVAFALASLGFGLLRPGFTAGASLAVNGDEQASVAGRVTTVNGAVFIAGPAIGILLYTIAGPAPYWAAAALLLIPVALMPRRDQGGIR